MFVSFQILPDCSLTEQPSWWPDLVRSTGPLHNPLARTLKLHFVVPRAFRLEWVSVCLSLQFL